MAVVVGAAVVVEASGEEVAVVDSGVVEVVVDSVAEEAFAVEGVEDSVEEEEASEVSSVTTLKILPTIKRLSEGL